MSRLRLITFLIGLTGLVTVHGQAPTVTIKLTDPTTYNGKFIQAFRDTDVTMDCFVENLPADTTVRWQRTYKTVNGTSLILSLSQDMGLEDNIHYSIERPTQFTWKLRIRAIQVTDEGNYTCFVLTTLNSRAVDWRNISVVVPPYLDPQQTSSDMTVNEGEQVDLMCNATARPDPTIEWSRLGGALLPIGQEKKMGSVLSISAIKPEDRGVYRCRASNSVGATQRDINVNVLFQPVITVPRTIVYQAVGYRVELQCFVEGNPLPTSSQAAWSKGSTTYTMSSEGYDVRFLQGAFGKVTYELIIYSVQDSDYGLYYCRIKNSIGSNFAQITLTKTSTPQASIKLGQVIAGGSTSSFSMSLTMLIPLLFCLLTVH